MKRNVLRKTNSLIKSVKSLRNAKKELNPSKIPTEILERRSIIMSEFAKQFKGIKMEDKDMLQKLRQYRKDNKLREIYKGELTPEVLKAIDNYVLPHFYRHASQTISILSRNNLDTWNQYIWRKYVKPEGKPLHNLLNSDKALCSYMHSLLKLNQPHEALGIYTDQVKNKLDKMAVTPAIQALSKLKQWNEMRHLFRVFIEKRPDQVDYIMIKTILGPLSREQNYDHVLSILHTYIQEINDETEIIIMTPLYQCKNENDMKKLLNWCFKVKKNLTTKLDTTIHMFESAKLRWPKLEKEFSLIIHQLDTMKLNNQENSDISNILNIKNDKIVQKQEQKTKYNSSKTIREKRKNIKSSKKIDSQVAKQTTQTEQV